jgi:hypothetical protein
MIRYNSFKVNFFHEGVNIFLKAENIGSCFQVDHEYRDTSLEGWMIFAI